MTCYVITEAVQGADAITEAGAEQGEGEEAEAEDGVGVDAVDASDVPTVQEL